MKKFIKQIAVFSIIVISFLSVGEFFVRSLPNPYKFKDGWMNKNASNIELIVLGTSQSEMGIIPNIISTKGFNLAMPHGTFEYDKYLLYKYSNKYQNLKHVIIELSYYNLFARQFEDNPDSRFRTIYYTIYMDYPKHKWSPYYNFEFSHLDFYRSHIQNGVSAIMNNLPFPDECDSIGCVIQDGCLAKKDYDKFLEEISDVTNSFNYGSDLTIKKNLQYFDDILSFCYKNHVEPTIVILPLPKEFNEQMSYAKIDRLKKTVKLYRDKGFNIINYMESDLFHIDDFLNANHLNRTGAIKLSNLLKQELTNR